MTQQSEEMEPFEFSEMPTLKPKFITIVKKDFRVEVHLRGEFPSSEECTKELLELYELSDSYETVVVFISSPGGAAHFAVELISVLGKFKNVITIAAGMIASAGFLIWGVGDLRVVQKHTWIMIHRESYIHIGQTDTHLDLGNYNQDVYSRLLSDACSFLTDEEIEKAKRSDVYITSENLIERGHAISWEEFSIGEKYVKELVSIPIFSIGPKLFIKLEDGTVAPINNIDVGEPLNELDLFYKSPVELFQEATLMTGERQDDE